MRLFSKLVILLFSSLLLENALAADATAPDSVNVSGGYSSSFWATPPQGTTGNQLLASLYLFTMSPSYNPGVAASQFYNTFFQQQPVDNANESLTNIIAYTQQQNSNMLAAGMQIPLPIDNTNFLYSLKNYKLVTQPLVPGTNTGIVPTTSSSASPAALASAVAPISLDSLIGTTQYSATVNKDGSLSVDPAPLDYINYVSGQYTPSQFIDFSGVTKPEDKQSVLSNSSVQAYLAALRQYAASVSTGLSNLAYLYQERVPQPTSTVLQGASADISGTLPDNLKTQASPLAIDQWMATRRLMSTGTGDQSAWLNEIEQAGPATLQRENALLNAENRYELFQIRQDLERLIALMSVSTLQSAQQSQMNVASYGRQVCQSVGTNKALEPLQNGGCPAAWSPQSKS